jgi:RNA polymerase sigma factor (sigma-70 family)
MTRLLSHPLFFFQLFSFLVVIMANKTELNGANVDIHKDLIAACKKGDRVAQYRLYKLYSQAMYNICLRMVSNEQEAQDLLQESFIKAFSKLKTFRGDCTFGVWLKRIVINQCISFLRKKKPVMVDIETHDPGTNTEEEVDAPSIDPEVVNKTIRELPDKARMIFTLFCVEGYRHKEIAEMLDITESTSKTQFHRAKIMVQQKIREQLYEN